MKEKKRPEEKPAEHENPLLVDEKKFTDVIRKLAGSKPMPLAKMRRKNPETDPRYLPVFPELERKEKKRKP